MLRLGCGVDEHEVRRAACRTVDPDQRADIIRQAGLQYGVARQDQVDRNTAAYERARDFGVRDELVGHIGIPVKDADALPFPTAATHDPTANRALRGPVQFADQETPTEAATGPGGPTRDYLPEDAGGAFTRGLQGVVNETADLFSDVIVGFRGGKKFIGEDGNTYAEYSCN